MCRRLIRGSAVGAVFVFVSLTSGSATADEGGFGRASADASTGTIAALASNETVGGRTTSDAQPSKPRCTFEVYTDLQMTLAPVTAGPIRREADGAILPVGSTATRTSSTLYKRSCPGSAGFTLSWVPDFVDVNALVASAHEQVTAKLPGPELDMNPDPTAGGTVNIGLWLAVDDPGQVSITASVGPVWATVTARFEGTTWDMGNGDLVECEGLGTPIADLESPDEGPCGYTYRWPSAPKFTGTDDLAYHASVTGHWAVTYATSTGAGGSLPGVDRTTGFEYQVRELQTLRVSDDG